MRMTPEIADRMQRTRRFTRVNRVLICLVIGFNAWFAWRFGGSTANIVAQAVALVALYANIRSDTVFLQRHELLMAANDPPSLYAVQAVPYLAHLLYVMLGMDPYLLYRRSYLRYVPPGPGPNGEVRPPPMPGKK